MRPETSRPLARPALAAAALALALAAAGCRQDMHNAPRYKPLAESDFFANGSAARALPAHAIARGGLREDALFNTGFTPEGDPTPTLPLPVTRALLERGHQRFDIFCSPCHGRVGEGNGMVVRRGFKPPSSYHVERLRQAPVGYFFDVMTNGFGVMPSYAAQVSAEDRWAIAAYIRALQLSQYYDAARLNEAERADLEPGAAAPAGEPR